MTGNRAALLVLLGAGAYYVTRPNPITGRTVADDLFSGLGLTPLGAPTARTVPFAGASSSTPASGTAAAELLTNSTANRTAQIVGLGATAAGVALPALGVGGTAAATGTAAGSGAAAGGAGIGLAGALTITGVAAGAAVLAWAIVSKGLFRGGDEGIHVNPARTEYLQAFNKHYGFPPSDPGLGDGRGFAQACADVGMPGYEADRLLRRIHAADHMDEWKAATDDATATFQAYESLNQNALPSWRQAQLQGGIVFANGQTVQQLIAATMALGSGYADLVTSYRTGF